MPDKVSQAYIQDITDVILNNVPETEPVFDVPEIEVDALSPAFRNGKFELPKIAKAPSFWENVQNQFVEHEEILAAARFADKVGDFGAPDISQEIIPDGWSAFEMANIQDLPDKYWDYILDARSPNDLEYRRGKAFAQVEWDERLEQGGFFSTLLGAGAGILASPSTWFLPIGGVAKYGNVAAHVGYGMLKTAPKLVAQGIIHEGIIQAGKIGGNLEDTLVNGLRDSAFGIAFYGAGRGLTFTTKAANVWKARKIVNVSYKGINVVAKTDEKGLYKGLVAEAIPGQVISPADLSAAQAFLDNGAVISGLSGLIGPLNKIPLFASPLIKGLTSPFGTVRSFYNRLGNQSVITGSIDRGVARKTTAEEILDVITRSGKQTAFKLNELFFEQMGLKPGIAGSAKAVVKAWNEGVTKTKAGFYADVQRAVFTGTPSTVKEVNAAAKVVRDHLDTVWKQYLAATNQSTDIVMPKTAAGYLMRMYNIQELTHNPKGWTDMVVASLTKQDDAIRAYKAPINALKSSIKELEDLLAAMKKLQNPKRAKINAKHNESMLNQIAKLQNKLVMAEATLEKQIKDGLVDLSLLEPGTTSFRELYASQKAMTDAAEGARYKILNMTPEQLSNQTFGEFAGTANATKERSLLIPDIDILDSGFLSNDLEKMVQLYSRSIGKRTALNTVFPEVDWTKGSTDLMESLRLEHDAKVAAIPYEEGSVAYKKASTKLNNELRDAQKLTNDAYNYYMGNSRWGPDAWRYTNNIRNWTGISMLRNVPLSQVGELGGMVFKQRLWPFVSGGIVPLLKNINSKVARSEFKANAAHARVGIELSLDTLSNALFNPSLIEEAGTFTATLQRGANASNAVFLTSELQNLWQKLSANITQSRVMGDLFAAAEGKLSPKDAKRLLINGIDPKDAKRFIADYKASGGFQQSGGYVSKWYEWQTPKLREAMGRAIRNDIRGSILQASLLDKPFWMRDPVLGLPFQFMGYVYSAFNNFTVPLLQSPDASRVLGFAMMLGWGAMIEPLSKFQKGKPFELDDEKSIDQWFYDGLSRSGVMGYQVEIVQMLDALLDLPFLDRYKQDRFRRRPLAGIILGPAGGLGQNMVDTAHMFISGKINEEGLRKAKNLSPVPVNALLDNILNKAISGSGVPETRGEADYYSFWDRD